MNKRDVAELKKRFKKESCTISRMAGCYVDANKEKVLKLNETFLNLGEEEFYKFLEIAKKTLAGTIGNNILELDFPLDEEAPGGKQQFLYGLRASNLDNEELLDRLYDLIIDSYQYVGNYLILIFHDSYDIMKRTTDKMKLDESEEVYEYLLVSICPVALSKPGLGYRKEENRIGARIRDWVVGVPDLGFLFPAFCDSGADIHKVDYFIRDAKDSHPEFVSDVLGCGPKLTATEQKQTFHAIVKKAFGPDEEVCKKALLGVQEVLNEKIGSSEELTDPAASSVILTDEAVEEALVEQGMDEVVAKNVSKTVKETFGDDMPSIANLIDEKALEANARIKKEQELVKEVSTLKTEIVEKDKQLSEAATYIEDLKTYDVVLRVKPDKASKIKSQILGDQKYLMIPMDENEHVNLNGVNTQI
ncbi:MAG: DUF4317 domain-containing protein [Lachnospiraceae bacterium]|nr:DUF4317 domain-containing protein [Lachnospiraceae bacterium]